VAANPWLLAAKPCFLAGTLCLLAPGCSSAEQHGSEPGSSDSGSFSRTGENDLGTRPLAAPKFTFVPGPPGRAVGVRARVLLNGVELDSNEVEVNLLDPMGRDPEGSSFLAVAPSHPQSATASDDPASSSAHNAPTRPGGTLPALPALPTPPSKHFTGVGTQPSDCPKRGSLATSMGAVNGSICYVAASYAQGALGAQLSATVTTIFAREGIYSARTGTGLSYVPPDYFQISHTWSVGCIPADIPGAVTREFYDSLESLSFSYSVLMYSQGLTLLSVPKGPTRALQVDAGISVSLGLAPFVGNFGIAIEETDRLVGPFFVRPWSHGCGSKPTADNLFEYAKHANAAMAPDTDDELADALTPTISEGFAPLLEVLGSSGEGGIGPGVPAASNGDFFAEMLSHTGTEPLDSALPNSADGLVHSSLDRLNAVGSDPDDIVAAAAGIAKHAQNTVPSRQELIAVLSKAATAALAVDQLATATDTEAEERFVASKVVTVHVPSGEKAHFTLTAEEVAELLERPTEDVIGATVVVNGGPDIVDVSFVLTTEGLVLNVDPKGDDMVLRFDVDLSTAAGEFPDSVASWLVRPAVRLIRIDAGEPAEAVLLAPSEIVSGSPASMSLQVLDANGRVVPGELEVSFTDAAGNSLGRATGTNGAASLQYVPAPTQPEILAITAATVTIADEASPAIRIEGLGFSVDATVTVDEGTPLLVGEECEYESSTSIVCPVPEQLSSGNHVVRIANPGDKISDEFSTEL
jgi:hypothetical protein